MMIDTYTKIVLTVIALALMILVFQNIGSALAGNHSVQKVVICNESGFRCADISRDFSGRLKVTNAD